MKRRRNLVRLLTILILLLLIVSCLLIVIQSAFAEQLASRYPGSLRSVLMADYSADPEGTVRKPINPALIADLLAEEAAQTPASQNTLLQRMAMATALFSGPVPTVTPIPPEGGAGMATPSGPGPTVTAPSSPREEETPATVPAATVTGAATTTVTPQATATSAATTTVTPQATATATGAATTTVTPQATATATPQATATATNMPTATPIPPTSPPTTEKPPAPTATPTTVVSLTASSKSASQAWVFPHEYVTYTITTVNNGTGNATGVTVEDTVPAELTLDSASIFGPAWTLLGSTILWGPFDVMAGQSRAMGFRAKPLYLPLPDVPRRPVANVARIAANGIPPFDQQVIIEVPFPPNLDFASPPNLNPQVVLAGQTGVVFHIDVVNVGSADITLNTSSEFTFEDAGNQLHSTYLSTPTFLPTGGVPVTLDFAPLDIPIATSAGSSAWVSLFLIGLDENNVIHSKALTTTAAANQITVQAPPPPPQLHDLSSSLAPANVDQGQIVSFTIWVYNDGGSDVTLDTTSTISFTDGTTVYLSNLISPTSVPNWGLGSPVQIIFAPFNVGAMAPSLWPTNLYLHGSDAYGRSYSATFTANSGNWVTVNAAPVLRAYPTPMPSPPFNTGAPINFSWVNVQNVGNAGDYFANSSDYIVMAFEPGSGWAPFTNGQVFPLPSGFPPTPPPGWQIITDTLNPVITFTVATLYSPYTWNVGWQASFGFNTVAPATAGVYTFTVHSTLNNGTRHFVDVFHYTVQ